MKRQRTAFSICQVIFMIHAFKQAFSGWIGNDFQRDVHCENMSRVHPQLGLLMGYYKALLSINQP